MSLLVVALQRPLRARRVLALGAVVLLVHLLDVILEVLALPRGVGTLLATALEPRVTGLYIQMGLIDTQIDWESHFGCDAIQGDSFAMMRHGLS